MTAAGTGCQKEGVMGRERRIRAEASCQSSPPHFLLKAPLTTGLLALQGLSAQSTRQQCKNGRRTVKARFGTQRKAPQDSPGPCVGLRQPEGSRETDSGQPGPVLCGRRWSSVSLWPSTSENTAKHPSAPPLGRMWFFISSLPGDHASPWTQMHLLTEPWVLLAGWSPTPSPGPRDAKWWAFFLVWPRPRGCLVGPCRLSSPALPAVPRYPGTTTHTPVAPPGHSHSSLGSQKGHPAITACALSQQEGCFLSSKT